jgi:hypothetical protein
VIKPEPDQGLDSIGWLTDQAAKKAARILHDEQAACLTQLAFREPTLVGILDGGDFSAPLALFGHRLSSGRSREPHHLRIPPDDAGFVIGIGREPSPGGLSLVGYWILVPSALFKG